MQNKETRKLAAQSLKECWSDPERSKALRDAALKNKERKISGDFTIAEREQYKQISKNQKGKTMKERCGEDYVDPRKGKTRQEIMNKLPK
tara:strand:+ start:774 stop:1043 length:270 start_codon:yes stop_codon:yes gene_type:complete